MANFTIDPTATLDFAENWSSWLADGETITAQTVTAYDANGVLAPDSITLTDITQADGIVTVWCSAANPVQSTIHLTFHITTSQGRQDDRTMTLFVSNR